MLFMPRQSICRGVLFDYYFVRNVMEFAVSDLNVPHRLLLGPGPSAVHPRVLRTMGAPLVGYLDPAWLALMDEEQMPRFCRPAPAGPSIAEMREMGGEP